MDEAGGESDSGAWSRGRDIISTLELRPNGHSTDWDQLVQAHVDWAVFKASTDKLPVIDIHSL